MKSRHVVGWTIVIIVAALAVGGWSSRSTSAAGAASTARATAPAAQSGIPALVSSVSPSVVTIITGDGLGSGVVWSTDGMIVTADHVVTGSTKVKIQFSDGNVVNGRVLAGDRVTDLAVVRADRNKLRAATFAKTLPKVGALAIAIGSPLGFENTASAGIVSGLHRSLPGGPGQSPPLLDLVQTDADISPGDSGGALVDAQGHVVGINEAFIPPSEGAVSIGFATPAPRVARIVGQLLKHGEATHPSGGAQLTELSYSSDLVPRARH